MNVVCKTLSPHRDTYHRMDRHVGDEYELPLDLARRLERNGLVVVVVPTKPGKGPAPENKAVSAGIENKQTAKPKPKPKPKKP